MFPPTFRIRGDVKHKHLVSKELKRVKLPCKTITKANVYNTILFMDKLPARGFSVTIYNSLGNQIDIAQIAIYNCFSTNQIKLNVGFWWEGKTGVLGEKPLIAEKRTIQLNAHLTPSAEIEPGPHWWRASALTTKPTLSRVFSPTFALIQKNRIQNPMQFINQWRPVCDSLFFLKYLWVAASLLWLMSE